MASKKKTAYGKRYSEDQKLKIINQWKEEARQTKPRSKAKFCATIGISTITLNAWLDAVKPTPAPSPAKVAPKPLATPDAPAPVAQEVIIETPTLGIVVYSEDAISQVVEQIRIRQQEIGDLKARLLTLVDAL